MCQPPLVPDAACTSASRSITKIGMVNRTELEHLIHDCEDCPRLRRHCLEVARTKRRAFIDEEYWGRPVAPFGPTSARLVVFGLAPAAHGANRTGRIFTGDRSGEWLYRALHRFEFANQPTSTHRDDGLVLRDAVVTCAVKCAPPQNKPTPQELRQCLARFAARELELFKNARVYVALGKIAWDSLWSLLGQAGSRPAFAHGREIELTSSHGDPHPGQVLLGSFHPSQQNTFTGRLTEPMFDAIFRRARELIGPSARQPSE